MCSRTPTDWINTVSVLIAVVAIWVTMATGTLKLSVLKDAWDRTCHEHYWPERFHSNKALGLVIALAPVGFVVALYSARRMRKNPLPPPEWALQMMESLERNNRALKTISDGLQNMSAHLSETIVAVESVTEAIESDPTEGK